MQRSATVSNDIPHTGGQEPSPVPTDQTQVVAHLLVDATSCDSKVPQWLKSLGYTPPSATIIPPLFGYATRLLAPSSASQRDWMGVLIHADPPSHLRSGASLPTDEGHWSVNLGGTGKAFPH